MKVVVAIDSFKGSMTSIEAGNAAKEGVLRVFPKAEVVVMPLADGGEGTTEVLVEGLGGKKINVKITGPMNNEVLAYYGILGNGNIAVMEMASAAGITLIPGEKNPLKASTYGVGEMILDAVKKGCREFIIGIGGSATNDGGVGMLKALGYEFYDSEGRDVGEGGGVLGKIFSIIDRKVPEVLRECKFRIACDVNNPLCGLHGATYMFGPQKGVTKGQEAILDQAMRLYANVTALYTGKDFSEVPGSGAAGGLGFAFMSFLKAELIPGAKLICEAINLQAAVRDADIVITGEGCIDAQTIRGKAPAGVANIAKLFDKKVIAFAGGIMPDAAKCNQIGFDAFFPIVRGVTTLKEAMQKENAIQNLADTVEQVFRLL